MRLNRNSFRLWWSRPGSSRAASSTVDHSDIRGSSSRLAVMVVIPRALPRTERASCGRRPAAGCSAPPRFLPPLGCADVADGELLLDLHPHRPDETSELAGDRRHHLLLRLAASDEARVAIVQTVLRLPGDLLHLRALSGLARSQLGADGRSVPVGPGRLDENAAQVRISGLGDGPTPDTVAAGVLA